MAATAVSGVTLVAALSIRALEPPPGGGYAYEQSLNNLGTVAGYAEYGAGLRACVWRTGPAAFLPEPADALSSYAAAINDRGMVVGAVLVPRQGLTMFGYFNHAAIWMGSGDAVDLGVLAGGDRSVAIDVNNLGQVLGVGNGHFSNSEHGFIWQAGRMTDLGVAPGGIEGFNDAGAIVGTKYGPPMTHGFVWRHGNVAALPPLPGGSMTVAHRINSQRWVIGYSTVQSRSFHATVWRSGQPTDLGTLPGGLFSEARGINDGGDIVGWGDDRHQVAHALLWTGGKIIDLGKVPGSVGMFAVDINNAGQILGEHNVVDDNVGHPIIWEDTAAGTSQSHGPLLPVTIPR